MGHSGDTWTHFQSVFSKFQSEMKFVGITCISAVFLAFGHGFHSSQINFNGYQVLRVKIENEVQLNTLQRLESIVDFWTEPEVGGWSDVMVSPFSLPTVTRMLSGKGQVNQGFEWTVWIPDVGRIIHEQDNAKIKTNIGSTREDFWTQYQRLSSIFSWMDNLETEHSNFVSTHTIGFSYESRPIRLLKISAKSNNPSRPAVFLDSGIHAREWISPATLTYILDKLITQPEYADIRDGIEIHAVPVLNPDGYEYTHTTNRMWRKNRRPNGNCIGTDLNRNFPYSWCTVGGSNESCSDIYCGPGPGSEPEVQVVMGYLSTPDVNWWGYVSLHSYAQEWCIPWAYTAAPAPDHDDMWAVGQKAVDALEGTFGTPYTLKIPSGRYGGFSMDWAKGVWNIKYSVLIELRDTGRYGFLLPPAQIIPSGEETLAAIVAYLREIIRQFL